MTPEQLEEILAPLRSQHGEVWHNTYRDELVVFRCPKMVEYNKYIGAIADEPKTLGHAQEELAKAVVVYPDRGKFDSLLQLRCGIAGEISGDVMRIAKDKEAVHAKKG